VSRFLDEFRGSGPLRDVTILDFTQMMMGPVATQLMGDLGALVIKVERPVVGEWERSYLPDGHRLGGESPYFLAMNRNKLGLAVDIKDPHSLQQLLRLLPHVDAVVHNYRPGVMQRLGLGYDELRRLNSRIVYASGSGFGTRGPWVERPGQDLLVQAASGLAADSGPAELPPVPSATPVVDAASGFLLAFNVVAAVLSARETGASRQVEASLLGTALLMQCQQAMVAMNTPLRYERSEAGVGAPWTEAPYGIYATSDGYLALSMVSREKLAQLLRLPDELLGLDDSAWFAMRDDVARFVADQLRERTTDQWLELSSSRDIWAAPALTLAEILEHPQVEANDLVERMPIRDGSTVRAIGMACAVSGIPSASRLPPPGVGEHNDVIWKALADRKRADEDA